MARIKNIIFDFGGVLLDLDQDATFKAFSELLEMEITKDNALEKMGSFVLDIEKGELTIETFIWKIQHLKNGNIDPLKIIRAYNAMLLKMRPEIFGFLTQVKQKYNTYILSNTNAIHLQYVKTNIFEKVYNRKDWNEFFTKVYYSHEIGMRKPDKEIFEFVMEDAGINPKETLFIDDTIENVMAALECGWHAVHHETNAPIESKLEQYIEDCGII